MAAGTMTPGAVHRSQHSNPIAQTSRMTSFYEACRILGAKLLHKIGATTVLSNTATLADITYKAALVVSELKASIDTTKKAISVLNPQQGGQPTPALESLENNLRVMTEGYNAACIALKAAKKNEWAASFNKNPNLWRFISKHHTAVVVVTMATVALACFLPIGGFCGGAFAGGIPGAAIGFIVGLFVGVGIGLYLGSKLNNMSREKIAFFPEWDTARQSQSNQPAASNA